MDTERSRNEIILHYDLVYNKNHDGVVHIYDVYLNDIKFPGERQSQPRLLLVLEYCAGGELLERLCNLRTSSQGLTERTCSGQN